MSIKRKALQSLMRLMAPYFFPMMGTAIVGAMTIVANTGLLAVSAILISWAALMPPLLDLMPMSAAVRLCGISRALFRYWERLASHSITFKLLSDLRVWYYQQLLPLVPGGVGDKTARLFKTITDDIEILKFFYLRVVAAPLTALVALVIASVVLAFFLPVAIPILWVAAILNGFVLPVLSRHSGKKNAAAAQVHELRYHQKLQDYVEGLEALWTYNRWKPMAATVLQSFMDGNKVRMDGEVRRGRLTALSGVISGLAMTAALFCSAQAVANNQLDGIFLLAVALIVFGIMEAVQPLPLAVSYYYDSIAAMEDMLDVTGGEPTGLSRWGGKGSHSEENRVQNKFLDDEKPQKKSLDIVFKDVTFTYPGSPLPALRNVQLDFPAGSKTAIIGHIGSGKTSLASLLMGEYVPQQGEICLGDASLGQWGKEEVVSRISLVSQQPYVFTATLRENLRLAISEIPSSENVDEELWAALEWADLADVARELPQGLDTLLSPNAQNFSAGERQRLALARMKLEDKPIIILDEALKNLDNITSRRLLNRILDFSQGRTLLFITHDLKHPEQMDRVVKMEGGRIISNS
ncbi:MAG: thiol reductant ABC exporter subunit CydC [Spirochaetaceae bacterium]|nr:thiol reductant ABC exporter subunit CydC [Spirochaetaceae bacterium]